MLPASQTANMGSDMNGGSSAPEPGFLRISISAVEHNLTSKDGTPVSMMVVYPRTPHGPQEPKFILDIMQRHLDWVDKHLQGSTAKAD